MDVDLRKLRYFVTVAECAGFRRAAERLHVAQPALTRQIRSFEGDMRAELFTRSSQGVSLTVAGEQLFREAEALLASANAMRTRLADLTSRAPRLTVGFAQGVAVAAVVRTFNSLHPHVEVDLVSVPDDDQAAATREGRVDVCFARAPLDESGLEVTPLFEEPCVVALPSDTPLASVDFLELRDLERFPRLRDRERAGHRRLTTATMEETLEHVAAQHGIAVLPASVAAAYPRPYVTYRRVNGLPSTAVVLAYSVDRLTPHVRSLVAIATDQTFTMAVA